MLHVQYRPDSFADYVGQDDISRRIRTVLDRAIAKGTGTAIWISGPSGAGKTSLAMLCADYVGATGLALEESDGPACDKAKVLEWKHTLSLCPMGEMGGVPPEWKCLIIDEAQAMTDNAVQAWLKLLENLPAKTLVIFTTTETSERELFGRFTGPFMRRCLKFALGECVGVPVVERLKAIAAREAIALTDGQAAEMVKQWAGNFGAAIAALEAADIPDVNRKPAPSKLDANVARLLGIAA